jgi:sirohydrochlorin cobaltochelatase
VSLKQPARLSVQRSMSMPIPIVLTAFGTTTKARQTYDFMDKIIKEEFPGHEVLWAFSSRMVRDRLKHKQKFEARHPHEVLKDLYEQGHTWAVVQSVHLLCGHEFYRMLEEVQPLPIRTSIGLPLFSSYGDYQQLAQALNFGEGLSQREALVLVGHGTDHPSWASYPTLENILREAYGKSIYVGVVEGCPSQEQVVKAVISAGVRKVRLIPLMIVAGVHFLEDLCENEDSWRAAFLKAGLEVDVETQGIGTRREVVRIFIDHIREALDVIPGSASPL